MRRRNISAMIQSGELCGQYTPLFNIIAHNLIAEPLIEALRLIPLGKPYKILKDAVLGASFVAKA
jgi:hypothetical protein